MLYLRERDEQRDVFDGGEIVLLDGSSIHPCRRTAHTNIVEIRIGGTGAEATPSAGSPISRKFRLPVVMRNEESRTRLYTLRHV
jgi:hypothetical protein